MPLTLKVLSFKGQPPLQYSAITIGEKGGTIGRSDDNSLVLPDYEQIISKKHAKINIENSVCYLEDTSTNGTFIEYQGQEIKLHKTCQQIFDGARLRIGEYEIAVSIVPNVLGDSLFGSDKEQEIEIPSLFTEEISNNQLLTDNGLESRTDHDNFQSYFESELQNNRSPLCDSYIAPEIISPPSGSLSTVEDIPEDFSFDDLFSGNNQQANGSPPSKKITQPESSDNVNSLLKNIGAEIEQSSLINTSVARNAENLIDNNLPYEPIPEIPSRNEEKLNILKTKIEKTVPVATENVLFDAFLQGVEIECSKSHPEQQIETMRQIGQMFRKLIDGTLKLLRSRAEFRSTCRLNVTTIREVDNNQFKVAVSTNDLLQQLIENKNNGYLKSTVAIEEAFNDLMSHQMAMQAGIQASLSELLKDFDPQIIEKKFEQGFVLQKKSKCWESYEESYPMRVEEAIENFYGEAFIKAYEQQMRLLKKSRNKD